MRVPSRFRSVLIGLSAALCLGGVAYAAAPVDPAAVQIDALDRGLISVTRTPTQRERVATLAPVIAQTFNPSVMASFVVGAGWARMTPADQSAIAAALSRYMTGRLAREFATAQNATITIDPTVQVRGVDKVVRTVVSTPGDTPDRLDYRMRAYGGVWKVIDVYYNGVSELTTRRADLAATLATGNVAALVTRIDATTAGFAR